MSQINLLDNFQFDEDSNGDLVIRDTTSGIVAAKYDRSADAWTFNDKFTSITTGEVSITKVAGAASLSTDQTISTGTTVKANLDTNEIEDSDIVDVDLTNNKLIAKKAGKYRISGSATFRGSANWSAGDRIAVIIRSGGTTLSQVENPHPGGNVRNGATTAHIADLTADTDIELFVFHARGGDETLEGSTSKTHIEAELIG